MIANNTIILYILIFVIAILIAWVVKTEIRIRKIFAGKKGGDLENVISLLLQDIEKLQKSGDQTNLNIKQIEQKLKTSIRGLETVRFKPFKDSGSNQSFAIALINEEGDGVIISSLYSRERMSIFAKPIKKYSSEYELTQEEKDVLSKVKI
jgi:hypothetical protein